MDENLPTENNNPGDLRFAGQTGATQGAGGFAAFANPQAGGAALLNQIQTSINNKPTETLEDFSSSYAPASDGNNPAQYAVKLANQLGVSPLTPISQLEPEIGKFAEAITNNEGYDSNNNPQIGNTAHTSPAPNSLGTAAIGGLGALSSEAASVGENALPYAAGAGGATIGAALAPETGGLSLAIPAVAGAVSAGIGQEVKGLLQGNQTQPTQSTSQTAPVSTLNLLGGQSNEGETAPTSSEQSQQGDTSKVASAFDNVLSTTVGGIAAQQEANNRGGIGSLGTVAANMGLIPEVDENGNYDKVAPTLIANAQMAQDADYQDKMLDRMTSPTEIGDARSAAEKYIREQTVNTGDTEASVAHSNRYFDDIEANRPMMVDKNGKQIKTRFLKPKEIQEMQKKLSVNEKDFARPQWERSAATHIKASLVKRLDEIAKQEKIHGWSETKKRMEVRFAIKKAIKALPKKAPRDFKKEFMHDLMVGAGGALIGKTLGHGLIGGTAGYLLASRLGGKHYKSFGSKKEQEELSRRSQEKPKSLLSHPKDYKNTSRNEEE